MIRTIMMTKNDDEDSNEDINHSHEVDVSVTPVAMTYDRVSEATTLQPAATSEKQLEGNTDLP